MGNGADDGTERAPAPPAPPAPSTGLALVGSGPGPMELGVVELPPVVAGTWEAMLDDKLRFLIPQDVRRSFRGGAIARAARAGCVTLVPTAVHSARTDRLALDIDDALEASGFFHDDPAVEDAEELLRLHNHGAAAVAWDDAGRVSLPARLREHARLVASTRDAKRTVLIAGMGSRAEIWEPAIYAAHIIERTAARRARAGVGRS